MDTLYVAPYEKANADKGQYPDGFSDGVVIHVIENPELKGYTHRLLRGAGSSSYYALGEQVRVRHDQTRRDMGVFTVVGYVVPDTGKREGAVPRLRLPLWSIK